MSRGSERAFWQTMGAENCRCGGWEKSLIPEARGQRGSGDWREQARALARLPEQDTGPRRPGKEVDSICKAAFKQGGALMGL